MEHKKELTRWRMILGEESQQDFEGMQEDFSLTDRELMMDAALSAIYGGCLLYTSICYLFFYNIQNITHLW